MQTALVSSLLGGVGRAFGVRLPGGDGCDTAPVDRPADPRIVSPLALPPTSFSKKMCSEQGRPIHGGGVAAPAGLVPHHLTTQQRGSGTSCWGSRACGRARTLPVGRRGSHRGWCAAAGDEVVRIPRSRGDPDRAPGVVGGAPVGPEGAVPRWPRHSPGCADLAVVGGGRRRGRCRRRGAALRTGTRRWTCRRETTTPGCCRRSRPGRRRLTPGIEGRRLAPVFGAGVATPIYISTLDNSQGWGCCSRRRR